MSKFGKRSKFKTKEECEADWQASHGGKRKGSGRKPREDGKGRTVPKSIKVSQEMADYLAVVGTGIVEDTLRKTKAFKDWAKSR
jgi:hypothetical protein